MIFILFALFITVGLFVMYFLIDKNIVNDDIEDIDYGC
jgi:low temperature requirement protein LtrA